MRDAQISWIYIDGDKTDLIEKDIYAGSYNSSNIEAKFDVQIWNNRWGSEDVKDIENASMIMFFDTLEDNRLLELCDIKLDNGSYFKPDIINGKLIVPINRIISGSKNNGTLDSNNYINISIKVGPITDNLKNGLKNIILDLQYDL